MIATTPAPFSQLIFSDRLGLVSVPNAFHAVDRLLQEPAFDEEQARDLLEKLALNLGTAVRSPTTTALEKSEESESEERIPESDHEVAVRKTLDGMDQVWIQGENLVAIFVFETGNGAWEGLRRLADLMALHPKLKAPLYVVSVLEMQTAIAQEIHRPAFRLQKRSLPDALRLLDWNRLRDEIEQLGERVRYLKPEFLAGISELLTSPSKG